MRRLACRVALVCLVGVVLACQEEPPTTRARVAKRPGASAAPQASRAPQASAVPATSPAPSNAAPASTGTTAAPSSVPSTAATTAGVSSSGGGSLPAAGADLQLVRAPQQADTWVVLPSLRRPRAGLAAGVLGDFVLVSDGEPRATNEALSLDEAGAQGWGLATVGGAASGVSLAAFASTGSQLVMAGGSSAGEFIPVTRLDELEQAGSAPPELYLPDPLRAAAGAWSEATGELLVFGGETYNGLKAGVQRVRLAPKGVTQGAGTAEPFAGAAAALVGPQAWVVGGYTRLQPGGPVQALSTVRRYDVAANTWRISGDGQPGDLPELPAPRHSAALVASGGKLWLLGGAGADGRPVAEVLRLDPAAAAPAWEVVTSLPTPRALLAAVAFGTRIMAIGGVGVAGQPLATVEVYQP
ncbi:MAG: hypothetical protein VKS61_10480 [Candidatus Sericytochromatia bacterium]|nr:hypothetical protein [Candidatus Sericytochromatia bacterium]